MPTSPPPSGHPAKGRPTPTINNHYVPEWYQRRFLTAGNSQFHYLDLKPEPITTAPGRRLTRRAMRRLGPANCFAQDHLYTIKLGPWATDLIEHQFFGPIDHVGRRGVEFFADYGMREGCHEAFQGIVPFMDAQRFRSPRGLAFFATLTNVKDRNALLAVMGRVFQQNATMWTEGVWEIVSAKKSPTKFLLTDNPVTAYNAKAFPGSPFCTYPRDVPLGWVGTRTLFPLDLNTCLIITHLQHCRNPWLPPRKERTNARSYATTMFKSTDVQTGRELEEDEVRRINFMLKQRADRYIAACQEEWLYPEHTASATLWSKLDDDWFLMPNLFEVHMGGTILVGYKDGSSEGWDEYGRPREHPNFERHEKDESITHRQAQLEWGAKRFERSIGLSQEFHFRGRRKADWTGYMREDVERYIAEQRAKRDAKRGRGAQVAGDTPPTAASETLGDWTAKSTDQ